MGSDVPRRVRRVLQLSVWPLRRFFLPQFAWVRAQIVQSETSVIARIGALDRRVDELMGRLDEVEEIASEASVAGSDALGLVALEVRRLSDRVAEIENGSHPYSASAGLELPLVFHALGSIPQGSRILCSGCLDGVPQAIEMLGFETGTIDDPTGFDAAVCMATSGPAVAMSPGDFDNSGADRAVLARLRDALRPGARLVLSLPYRSTERPAARHAYTPQDITELLDGWSDVQTTLVPGAQSDEWATGVVVATAAAPSA